MVLIRFLLISLIVYLIIRSFVKYTNEKETSINRSEQDNRSNISRKGVSKKVGEYVDYEEVDK
jgi:large-conductance mechanosensitive channel